MMSKGKFVFQLILGFVLMLTLVVLITHKYSKDDLKCKKDPSTCDKLREDREMIRTYLWLNNEMI